MNWTSYITKQIKFFLETKKQQDEWQYLFRNHKFMQANLIIDELPNQVCPKADVAARHDETFIFIELDSGESVAHNVAKYFYYFSSWKAKPDSVFLFHLLGPGFLETEFNYLFHMKLAIFHAKIMKEYFEKHFIFNYEQSKPFKNPHEAWNWLKSKLNA